MSVSGKNNVSPQHKGYGKLLVKTAQDIAADHKLPKISVISGIGTKEYYKNKCGFNHEGTYMTKNIEIIQTFRDIDRFFAIIFSNLLFCILAVLLI